MAEPGQNFRTAFHGFNREDVVRFLETATARHTAEVNQLQDDVARLEKELAALREQQTPEVSREERKTENEAPPTYEETPTVAPTETKPAAGSTNSSGQVYVPGFGYVENSGENTGVQDNNMYENGNKIGEMGGGN